MRSRLQRIHWKRRLLWAGLLALGAGVLTGTVLFLMAERIPGWYVPVYVADDKAEQQRVRDSLTGAVDRFRAGLAGGVPFEFRISDRTVNEWIVARAEIWPEAVDWLPDWLIDPVIRFTPGDVIVGARYERDGWKAILSLHLAPQTDAGTPAVRLASVRVGSLPVPLTWVRDRLLAGQALRRVRPDDVPPAVRRFLGLNGPNHPAASELLLPIDDCLSDASFRVQSLDVQGGELVLTIRPLAPVSKR